MAYFNLMDRLVIPALIAILIAGGVAGFVLGCALVINNAATLRFMGRMNRWVSTRELLAPLDRTISFERATADGRRPLLGTFLVVGGLCAVVFLLLRLDFYSRALVPGADARRVLSLISLQTTKWVLVAGSGFAAVVGAAMLVVPQRVLAFERRLNTWHSTEPVLAASEKMHTPLEPRVAAYPRASGWMIALASLCVTLAMIGLLVARIR